MEESHGNNDKDACWPHCTGEPKPDSCKSVKCGSRVGGTTERFGDDLPDETDESENIASGNPEVGLVSWRQLLEVRKTEFGL